MEGLDDFSALIPDGAGCDIPATAERGISLEQLLKIARFILDRASAAQGTLAHAKGSTPDNAAAQDLPVVEDINAEDDKAMAEEPPIAEKVSSTAAVTVHNINLYHFVDMVVKPATATRGCSYVELVAFSAWEQRPEWFVSHWWGEPIIFFVSCLQQYASVRGGRSVFWVCAYANSQHDLASSIGADPSQTSFRQALQISRGTVMILDQNATPFWRVWCAYEVEVTLCCPDKQLDLVTFVPPWVGRKQQMPMPELRDGTLFVEGAVQMISDGLVPEDSRLSARDLSMNKSPWTLKCQREKHFPLGILRRGMNVSVQHAKSSNPADRVRILNTITGAQDLEGAPAEDHPSYHRVNATLRLRFAMAMLHRAVMVGDTGVFEKTLVSVGSETEQHDRVFDFPSCDQLTDSIVAQIAEHLPAHTRCLSFTMSRCNSLTNAALQSLGGHLGRLGSLEKLVLTFAGCGNIDDDGVMAFCEGLRNTSKSLVSLTVDFSWCCGLQDKGIYALANAIKSHKGLTQLAVLVPQEASGYKYQVSDAAYAELAASIGGCEALQSLSLHLAHKDSWDGASTRAARSIGALPALRNLHLVMECCMSSSSLAVLGTSLGRLTRLTSLRLLFRGGFWREQQRPAAPASKGTGKQAAGLTKAVADPGLQSMAHGLQQLIELTELELSINGFRGFGDAEAALLATAIRKVKAFQELRLSMVGCVLQDAGTQALANAIAKHANLQRLCVLFSNCRGLGDTAAGGFARALFKLERLVELKLSFTGTAVGSSGLKAIAHNLTHVEGLTDLSLFLSELPNLDDSSIEDLGHCLQQLPKLRMLTVDVARTGATADAVDLLRQALAGMSNWTDAGSGQRIAFLPRRATQWNAGPTIVKRKTDNGVAEGQNSQAPETSTKPWPKGKGKGKGKGHGTQGFETIPSERRAELEERINAFVNSSVPGPLEFQPGELNPNERRLVHNLIEDVKGFITQSFGEGDGRYLAIFRDTGKLGRAGSANLERVVTSTSLPSATPKAITGEKAFFIRKDSGGVQKPKPSRTPSNSNPPADEHSAIDKVVEEPEEEAETRGGDLKSKAAPCQEGGRAHGKEADVPGDVDQGEQVFRCVGPDLQQEDVEVGKPSANAARNARKRLAKARRASTT